ncbi:PREDICTED: vacuolar protein sorting-associated protein 37C-like [Camelina sativa]|uniref:Vacuolar protein sorting-associated protein 37C-like n=1 Tax=Camelina sativa TaxID=90675 RepID=A0ABM0ZC14_CAMSA|nr:PREDICTED: vacuolar protein sorting-associated protein 37C-like [Camelina sativa]
MGRSGPLGGVRGLAPPEPHRVSSYEPQAEEDVTRPNRSQRSHSDAYMTPNPMEYTMPPSSTHSGEHSGPFPPTYQMPYPMPYSMHPARGYTGDHSGPLPPHPSYYPMSYLMSYATPYPINPLDAGPSKSSVHITELSDE